MTTNPHKSADLVAMEGDGGAVNAIAALAFGAAEVQELDARGIYVLNRSDGSHDVHDLTEAIRDLDQRAPAVKAGTYVVTTPEALIDYLGKHGLTRTEVWSNASAGTIKAVIDAHDEAGKAAGHEQHSVTLRLPFSDDWREWTRSDGTYVTQVQFAEHIEDHLPNFIEPNGATMLELAQTFTATTKVDFDSSQRLRSGETSVSYREDHAAAAGKKGSIAIPDTFRLGVQVFDGGQPWQIDARLRYRIVDGRLALAYKLVRPGDTLRDAFGEVVAEVEKGADVTVWPTT